jgi:hypothetical protein
MKGRPRVVPVGLQASGLGPPNTLSVIGRPGVDPAERTKGQRRSGSYRWIPNGVPFHPVACFLAHLLAITTCCHLAHRIGCRQVRVSVVRYFHELIIRSPTVLPRLDRCEVGCHLCIGAIHEHAFRAGRFVRAQGLPAQRPTIRPPDRHHFQSGSTRGHHASPPHRHQSRGCGPHGRSLAHRRGGKTARAVGMSPRIRASSCTAGEHDSISSGYCSDEHFL